MQDKKIQWFPGHMQKAIRMIEEKLKLIDVIIEICDARIPLSSRNPLLDRIIQNKSHIILLNKSDLGDRSQFSKWVKYYQDLNIEAHFVISSNLDGVSLEKMCQHVLAEKHAKMKSKGLKIPAIRAMVVGMPNVGKSTVINKISKRKSLVVGDRPGVTKAQQWIRVGKQFELLDTPGIMWPKITDQDTAYKIAATGAIKDSILPIEEVCEFLYNYLKDQQKVLKIKVNYNEDFPEFITRFCQERQYKLQNDSWNYERAYETFLYEYRKGTYGNFILDAI